MESAGHEHDATKTAAGARPRGATATVPSIDQEADLLRRARDAFRFGPDGRLLPVAPPASRADDTDRPGVPAAPEDVPDRATLEALRSSVSDDPVLDECFEEALATEPVTAAGEGRGLGAEAAASHTFD